MRRLINGERAVLELGGNVVRLVGLYHSGRWDSIKTFALPCPAALLAGFLARELCCTRAIGHRQGGFFMARTAS